MHIDIDDSALCKKCYKEYLELKRRRCSVCNKPLYECSCSNDYLRKHSVKKVIKVFRYGKSDEYLSGNHLIYSLKQDYRHDVIAFLSDKLSNAIKKSITKLNGNDFIIANIPRRKEAIRMFGYDHARLLAKEVAGKLDIQFIPLLYSKSKKAQKEAVSEERFKNVEYEYNVYEDFSLKGKRVILVDDIITTGASMAKGAAMIKALGAKEVIGATLAIAYKDSYTQPIKYF